MTSVDVAEGRLRELIKQGWYKPGGHSILSVDADSWINEVRVLVPLLLTAHEAALERVRVLEEGLEPSAATHVVDPGGHIIGLERHHFERARALLGDRA